MKRGNMVKFRLLLAALVIASVFSLSVSSSGLSCRSVNITGSERCDLNNPDPLLREVVVVNMTDVENAHGALPTVEGAGFYNFSICCRGLDGLSTASAPGLDAIAYLGDSSNAHYENHSDAGYTAQPIYLSANGAMIKNGTVMATTKDFGAAEKACKDAKYDLCLFAISDINGDAHLGNCTDYNDGILLETAGKIYGLCLNASCNPEGACQNGRKCINGQWTILPDSNGDTIQDTCDDCPLPCGSGSPCGTGFGTCPIAPCRGCVTGTVTSLGVGPVEGADVQGISYAHRLTDAAGLYKLAVPGGRVHDFAASKAPYVSDVKSQLIPERDTTVVDFVLAMGPDDCLPDCTRESNKGVCDKKCNGVRGCLFYDDTALLACDQWKTGFRRNYSSTQEVLCCEGSPYRPRSVKATTQINSTTIARITRNVWYEGKFVKMVVDVFD